MHTNYTVLVTSFAERHYIKSFKRKYKTAWDKAWAGIKKNFCNFNTLFTIGIAELITEKNDIKICKTKFRVEGRKQSKHRSGNRCIVAVHSETKEVRVLLVYSKTDISGSGNETAQWKRIIKQNYPEYAAMV